MIFTFLFLLFTILTSASEVVAREKPASPTWSVEKNVKSLLALLPKPQKPVKSGDNGHTQHLWDNYEFPCVISDANGEDKEAEKEDRADFKDPNVTLPRILLTHRNKEQLWVCTDKESLRELSGAHFQLSRNFSIIFRSARKDMQVLASEGEVMARPHDLLIDGERLILVKKLEVHAGKKTKFIPFTERSIECRSTPCVISQEFCKLSGKHMNAKKIVKNFDAAVARYKKHPSGRLDVSEPFGFLDQLLILAATGDKTALSRLTKFPIDVSGSAAASEILVTYKMYLDEARELKCEQP